MLNLSPTKVKRYGIDMTPLIDVVFLLLIFFMLTFAIQGQGLSISLPQGSETDQKKVEKDIIVKINQNDTLHLNDTQIAVNSLKEALGEKLKSRSNKLVVIDSAPKVKYGLFAQVLDISREAGAENFSIIK
ncbi:MAG: biopolymer transporter ExbD [Nitrospina sp.]|jgi:biopolymer transport protein ExbD|nr:biopolymer transporter ExbD [Nitrospina sp.]|tara:strand:+ start:477 stop:869 length:393 start_codon:yes stop_codon:yes gene_type:complete